MIGRGRGAATLALCAALACLGAPAAASASEPLFIYTPPFVEPPPLKPPPVGKLESPCGLAVDSVGNFYVADRYHDVVDAFQPPPSPAVKVKYLSQSPALEPCGLAIDSSDRLSVNTFHGSVGGIDPGPATGVAADPASDELFVDRRTYVAVYESNGAPVQVGGQPLHIGEGSLEDGYGIAVSRYPATAGFLYVPDAASGTVKVYDPATDTTNPVAEIDGEGTPFGHFVSLVDSAIAVDQTSGEIYVADDLQPESDDHPEAAIYAFSAVGAYEGRLKYNVVDARPPGLAVDNSDPVQVEGVEYPSPTLGHVYVTSGNGEGASVIAYAPGSAGAEASPAIESGDPAPPGGCACAPLPEPSPPVTCEGDSCQHLPSEPTDPTLNTLIEGAANPPVRFHDTNRLAHYRRLRHHHHAGRKAKHHKGGQRR